MKLFLYLLIFLSSLLIVSCSDSNASNQTSYIGTASELDTHRGSQALSQQIERFSLDSLEIDLTSLEVITLQKSEAQDEDMLVLLELNHTLMSAEKMEQLLDVKFTMSDEPVKDGNFVFGIESNETQKLTLEMFDEEGYQMTANNMFTVNSGHNYKSLNVKSMDSGSYLFRLKDDSGKELVKKLTIE